jgi:hypothetical protein
MGLLLAWSKAYLPGATAVGSWQVSLASLTLPQLSTLSSLPFAEAVTMLGKLWRMLSIFQHNSIRQGRDNVG